MPLVLGTCSFIIDLFKMSQVLNQGNKRQLLRQFEPLVVAATHKYMATQKPQVQQAVLLLLTTLIKFEVEFSLLDKDQSFFRTVAKEVNTNRTSPLVSGQLYFLAVLHIEVLKVGILENSYDVRNGTSVMY